AAFRTHLGTRARRGAGTVALAAQLHALEADVFLHAERRLAQRQRHAVLEVVAWSRRAPPPAATAEQHIEKVFKGTLKACTAAEPAEPGIAELAGCVAETVVLRALLGILQRVVGGVDLFELLFRRLVPAGLVRMVFVREFQVRPADLVRRRIPRDSQDFVIIAGRCHCPLLYRQTPGRAKGPTNTLLFRAGRRPTAVTTSVRPRP